MYVVVHKGEHYAGGTEAGVQILKDWNICTIFLFGILVGKRVGYIHPICVVLMANPYMILVNIIVQVL